MTNKIILIGNLTKDPEYSTSLNGTDICRFTLAVNRRGDEKADFFRVTTFRKTAELCRDYLAKGRKVCVVGEAHIEEFIDKQGVQRTSVEVAASEVEFLTPKETTGSAVKSEVKSASPETFVVANEDGLPF